MKKFNLSEIMKKAWEIRKADDMNMSAALKKSWALAKASSKPVFDGHVEMDGFTFNLWEKHGLRRIYINNFTGRNKSNAGGYINIENLSICASGSVKCAAQRFLSTYEVA